jgi:hypothetical protein
MYNKNHITHCFVLYSIFKLLGDINLNMKQII